MTISSQEPVDKGSVVAVPEAVAGGPVSETGAASSQVQPSVVKPCCACPETKKARDECLLFADSVEACQDLVEKHRICMASYGFFI